MKFGKLNSGTLYVFVGLAAFVLICSRFYLRFDLTENGIYSLSQGSLGIVSGLKEPVEARLYFSRSVKDMPVIFKQYGARVEEVLREYAQASDGKLSIKLIDPRPDTDEEEWAVKFGIQGVPLQNGERLFLGLVFLAGEKEQAIPYLDPRKEELLEYDISEALLNLGTSQRPKIGILSAFDVMGDDSPQVPGLPPSPESQPWGFIAGLRRSFEVQSLDPEVSELGSDLDVLFVIHPKSLSDKTLFAIDQFVMGGGRLLVAVDPFSRTDLARQARASLGQIPAISSNLESLFKAYGIDYDGTKVVGDLSRGTTIAAGGTRVIYPFFMTLRQGDLSPSSKITSQLQQVLFAEGGSVALASGSEHSFEALISTSSETGSSMYTELAYLPPAQLASQFKSQPGNQKHLAALFKGSFKSAFAAGAPEGLSSEALIPQAKQETAIIVVADADFLSDQNSVERLRFGSQVIMRPLNDNLNFVLNAAEFLGGNRDLMSIRSSGKISRPFTKVLEIQKEAQQKWQAEEEALTRELDGLQQKLSALQRQRTDGNRLSFSADQQSEIDRFREEERRIKKRRREVRKNLREDIESLGHLLVMLNLTITPLGVAGFGLWVYRRRARRHREEKQDG